MMYFGLKLCMHDADVKAKLHLTIIARVKLQVELPSVYIKYSGISFIC